MLAHELAIVPVVEDREKFLSVGIFSFPIGNLYTRFVMGFGLDIYNGMRYNMIHDTVIPRSWHRGYL